MTPELNRAIYTRSRLKKKFNKHATNENKTKFKKQRNKCVSIRRKAIKNHFKKGTENWLLSNQAFWDLVKPFLSNKGALVGSDISIVKNGTIITDDQDLSELFNEYYVNIVENTSGKKPCGVADTTDIDDDRHAVRLILGKYKNHPGVLAIVQNPDRNFETFSDNEVEARDVALLLKSLDGKKSTGVDQIPPKLVSLAANELTVPLIMLSTAVYVISAFLKMQKKRRYAPWTKGNQIALLKEISVQLVF